MGQIIVRKLDDAVIEAHRRNARARGVSLEQELRDVIATAATAARADLVRRLDQVRAMTPPTPAGTRAWTAEELIREDRDSR